MERVVEVNGKQLESYTSGFGVGSVLHISVDKETGEKTLRVNGILEESIDRYAYLRVRGHVGYIDGVKTTMVFGTIGQIQCTNLYLDGLAGSHFTVKRTIPAEFDIVYGKPYDFAYAYRNGLPPTSPIIHRSPKALEIEGDWSAILCDGDMDICYLVVEGNVDTIKGQKNEVYCQGDVLRGKAQKVFWEPRTEMQLERKRTKQIDYAKLYRNFVATGKKEDSFIL